MYGNGGTEVLSTNGTWGTTEPCIKDGVGTTGYDVAKLELDKVVTGVAGGATELATD